MSLNSPKSNTKTLEAYDDITKQIKALAEKGISSIILTTSNYPDIYLGQLIDRLEHQGFIVNHIKIKTMNPLPVFDLVIEW